MQEDKHIIAYSWKKDLVKRVREYLKNRKIDIASPTKSSKPTKTHNSPKVKKVEIPAKIYSPENNETKAEHKKVSKNKAYESLEQREKTVTYLLGTAIIFIMFAAVLIGNRIVNLDGFFRSNVKVAPVVILPSETPSPSVTIFAATPPSAISKFPTITPTSKPPLTPFESNCKISGCSSEVCADENLGEISTICIHDERYSCYQTAVCERQFDGSCGWTQSQELQLCLDSYQ